MAAALSGVMISELFENWGTLDVLSPTSFTSLDASTIILGSTREGRVGPGVVNEGLRFTSSSGLRLDRRNSPDFNLQSGALLSRAETLTIDFLTPVTHAGISFFEYPDFNDTATVRVYAADDTTLLYVSPSLDAPSTPDVAFFGYYDTDGIGRMTIRSSQNDTSPLIDNLIYASVPEPTSLALLGIGGLALFHRRR